MRHLLYRGMICPQCDKPIDSHDTETLLVISAQLGRRYERMVCGDCGKKIQKLMEYTFIKKGATIHAIIVTAILTMIATSLIIFILSYFLELVIVKEICPAAL